MKVCRNCKFWQIEEQKNTGTCHYNPPISGAEKSLFRELPKGQGGIQTSYKTVGHGLWPATTPDDWCGKFEEE